MALLDMWTKHFHVEECLFDEILHSLFAGSVMGVPTACRSGYVTEVSSLPSMFEPDETGN